MKIADLYADLWLDSTNFKKGLTKATAAAQQAGAEMAAAFGQRPIRAIQDTDEAMEELTWNTRGAWKDVGRVVTGILISQGFYKILSTIKETTASIVEFGAASEVANISFKMLLGNAEDAAAFGVALEQFAAVTPFQVDDARQMARQLLAMGFAAEEAIPMMRHLADAAAVAGGNPEVMQRMVISLGQMKTAGYATARELRELALAGIPIYEILQEELGLTAKQMERIGAQKIPAELAINAILRGMDRRYGGAAEEIAQTLPGLWSTVKDNFLLVTREMFSGAYDDLKGTVKGIADQLVAMQAVMAENGLGGLFEFVVPEELQDAIRLIIAGLKSLKDSIGDVFRALKPAFDTAGATIVHFASLVIPIFASVARAIANVAEFVGQLSPPLIKLIGYIMGLGIAAVVAAEIGQLVTAIRNLGIVTTIAKTVMGAGGLMKALAGLAAAHPVVAGIVAIVGAIIALIMSSDKARQVVHDLWTRLMAFIGIDPSKLWKPSKVVDDMTEQIDKYLEGVSQIGGASEEAAEDSTAAFKKFLAAFDEVFQVPEQLDEGVGAVAAPEIPDMPDLSDEEIEGPEITINAPDLGSLLDRIKDMFDDAFPIPIPEPFDMPPTASAPILNFITAMADAWELFIQSLPAWKPAFDDSGLINAFEWIPVLQEVWESLFHNPFQPATDGAYQLSEAMIPFKENLFEEQFARNSGAVLSFADAVKLATKERLLEEAFESSNAASATWQETIGVAARDANSHIKTWSVDSNQVFADWVGDTGVALGNWATNTTNGFNTWADNTNGNFSTWRENVNTNVNTWAKDTGATIGNWIRGTAAGVYTWGMSTGTNIANWAAAGMTNIGTFAKNTATTMGSWIGGTAKGVYDWAKNAGGNIGAFATAAGTNIANWAKASWTTFNSWIKGTSKGVYGWAKNVLGNLGTWAQGAWQTIKNLAKSVGDTLGGMFSKANESLNATTASIGAWVSDNKGWIIPVAIAAVATGAIALTVASGGTAAPALAPLAALAGLATGGIVTQEQIVRIGEGNKREAVIPLENSTYMQPFADAVAYSLARKFQTGAPGGAQADNRPILYVGTLIADDRGLRELERRMEIIRIDEERRRG